MDANGWISAIGSAASLIGIGFALFHITKTRKAAEAAQSAAESATSAIQRNVALVEVSTCVNGIEELKSMIRHEKFDVALIRATDLSSKLIQLKAMLNKESQNPISEMSEILTELRILRDLLEKKVGKNGASINVPRLNNRLSKISDNLNSWVGENKYKFNGEKL